MISVAVDALRLRFLREEVPGLRKLVLLERRRTAIELGLSSPGEAENIKSIWSPLPYPKELPSDDEQDMFITPLITPSALSAQVASPITSCRREGRRELFQ